jgi:predicted dehydrogenase
MCDTTKKPLQIGVLGCAAIARQFLRDTASSQEIEFTAVASRDGEKAAVFASDFNIKRAHSSYESLLDDEAVEAIYLPLPNSMHAEWTIKAANAGKHILCEKPIALGLTQARSMFAAAAENDVVLLEAYPWWFQPQTQELSKLLMDQAIGQIRSVQSCFGFTALNPATNIRMQPDLGGGALLDAGTYALSFIRLAMGVAPERVTAHASWSESGVDIETAATLHYGDGRRAQFSCAMNAANHRFATVVGSDGSIDTEYLNHTGEPGHEHGYQPSQLRVRRGIANTIAFEPIESATGSGFRFAVEAFARIVRDKDLIAMNHYAAMSLDIAATIEAVSTSSRSGQTEPVAPR